MAKVDNNLLLEAYYSIYIESSTKDMLNIWSKNNDPTLVQNTINLYNDLKKQQHLKGNESDISQWVNKPFNDFKTFIDQHQAARLKKQDIKDDKTNVIKVFENDKALVIVPQNHATACKYGAGTRWCIASKNDSKYWDDYKEQKIKIYYILPKEPNRLTQTSKIAISVPRAYTSDADDLNAFAADDSPLNYSELARDLKALDISIDIFTNIFDLDYFLKSIKHTITKDGYIDTMDEVNLSELGLKQMPLKFNSTHTFDCSSNELTSLIGSPKYVGGSFHCTHNKLTSLKDGPLKVDGEFNCSMNELTSLAGAPESVHDFICQGNKLTSLAGAPKYVAGNFFCAHNKLTSLAGAPKSVSGDFICYANPVKFTEQQIRAVCDVKGKVQVMFILNK